MKQLLIKGGAGLGDRIMAVATGLLYARMCGRRPIVDWSDAYYSGDGSNVFHRYYDCPAAGDLDELSITDSVNPEAWRGRLDQRVHPTRIELGEPGKAASWRSLSVDLLRTDHPEELLVMWSYRQRIEWLRPHMKGDFAELARRSTRDILRGEMEANLRPSAEVAERVAAFRREHLQGPSVGVHVRYTDRLTRLDVIRRRLERLLAKEDGLRVFVATDNVAIRDEFERSYGAVSAPQWYPAPGIPVHRSPSRPDPFDVGVDALVDLYLLTGCEHLICNSFSNFSQVAKVLSDAPRSQITDVQRLRVRWPAPLREAWRLAVPGPATPLALAMARRWAH